MKPKVRYYIAVTDNSFVADRDFKMFETTHMMHSAHLYSNWITAKKDCKRLQRERYLYNCKIHRVFIWRNFKELFANVKLMPYLCDWLSAHTAFKPLQNMKKEECASCPLLGDFCGKAICRVGSTKRYLRHIEKCSNASKEQPTFETTCRRCYKSRYNTDRELVCDHYKRIIDYDRKVCGCKHFKWDNAVIDGEIIQVYSWTNRISYRLTSEARTKLER